MNRESEIGFFFEEIDPSDAPSAETFWWGMWSGIAVVSGVVLAT